MNRPEKSNNQDEKPLKQDRDIFELDNPEN